MAPAVPVLLVVLAALTAQSAPPVVLTLRLTDGRRQFRPGEIIPFELEFTSSTPKRFTVDGATYDRSGRLTIDDFTIDRIDDVSDPMLDYYASIGGFIGGGLRGIDVLGEKPVTVKLELNDWLRFDKPGIYTLAVTSWRVKDESVTPHALFLVHSNTVSFEILPRDEAWEASELEKARGLVDVSQSQHGCRIMRFLGTEAAAIEMIRRYGVARDRGCDFHYGVGLFGVPNRAAVVQTMEDGLRAPDQPVTAGYLRILATLSVFLERPEFRPAQTRETKGRKNFGLLNRRGLIPLIDAAMLAYGNTLTAAIPEKTERARAITVAEMEAWRLRQRSGRATEWRDQLASVFVDLPGERQASLLEYQWRAIAGPAMLPVLRRLVDSPATNPPSVPDLALRRLAELAPDEGRPVLLREIRNPRRGATLKTLGVLPDGELPELDDVLAANLEASISEIHAALVHRYATRKVAQRILASVEDKIGRMACSQQASILAYFLRVDEPAGAALLDRAMASRETGCWRMLDRVADLRMTAALESRAVADLDSPDPEVVTAAIRTLGRHGSPAALGPLRAAFQRWHRTWSGRAAELTHGHALERPNLAQAGVEDAFRQAIGAGRSWLMRAADLRDLQSLCVTENCRTQTGYMIHGDDTRITVWTLDEPGGSHIELAQYRFTSIAELENKLAQYPRGTALTLQRGTNVTGDAAAAISRLEKFAASRGLSITVH